MATVDSVLNWLPLVIGGFYLLASGRNTLRELAAMVVGVIAAVQLLAGGLFLFDANARWHDGRDVDSFFSLALAHLAIGAPLGLLTGYLSGRLRRAPAKYLTVPGVVMSVSPIAAGGKVHWRVRFAYFAANGTAFESVDEVYVEGLRPGDNCTVVYPPDQPELGTFRSLAKPPSPAGAANDTMRGAMNRAAS